jgi:protein arginine N-methyltransferase 1
MYSIAGYSHMMADTVRMNAYAQALRQVVTPNSVVLDIGTGTGIFALLACRYGARRVFAVEPDDAIQVARQMAEANGFAEKIQFFQALSTAVSLPEPADVIISDLRGVIPLFKHHIPALADARHRLLAAGGTVIPHKDSLWMAVVEAPNLYNHYVTPWFENDFSFDMAPVQRLLENKWHKADFQPEQLLVQPQEWIELDYHTTEQKHWAGTVSWVLSRPGVGHGFGLWFSTELIPGVGFSCAPGQPKVLYSQAYFPWPKPVPLVPGDQISIRLQANLVGDDYIWQWATRIVPAQYPAQPAVAFQQSTFYGDPLSAATLKKRAPTYQPFISEIGRFALNQMDGNHSLETIAATLAERFPETFAKSQDALTFATHLSQQHAGS